MRKRRNAHEKKKIELHSSSLEKPTTKQIECTIKIRKKLKRDRNENGDGDITAKQVKQNQRRGAARLLGRNKQEQKIEDERQAAAGRGVRIVGKQTVTRRDWRYVYRIVIM
ncbi:hypothetical protein DENSPDRAFT_492669 [Dentipellis sp. KUC8613]|nr:hypothetical protein DENSPDRAFT_492669 [Dentipellis sp. KUC8613]